MKILEIDHGGLDISVEEPIQHVIIHTFSVNLKNVNMLDYMSLSVEHSDLHNWISPWCLDRRRETLEVRGFRGSLAIGIRALFYSRTSEANAQVRTSSELTFLYS